MGFNKELDAKHKEILNDIKKNLADISKDSNLLNREMFICIETRPFSFIYSNFPLNLSR